MARWRDLLRPSRSPAHSGRALFRAFSLGACVPRRPGRAGLPARRPVGDLPDANDPRGGLAPSSRASLLRTHDPLGLGRSRFFAARGERRVRQTRLALASPLGAGLDSQLGRPGGAAARAWHGGAAPPVPAAARERRRDPLLRAHRARGGLGRRVAHFDGRGDSRSRWPALAPPLLEEALHHPRSGRDAPGSRGAPPRSGEPPRRGHRARDHLRARPSLRSRRFDRPAARSGGHRDSERPDRRQGRARSREPDPRRYRGRRPRLGDAHGGALGRTIDLTTRPIGRRRKARGPGHGRLRAGAPSVRAADRPLRGDRRAARADCWRDLSAGRGAHFHGGRRRAR